MQPLGTYDLVLNIFVVIVMPLLIVSNLRGWGTASPLNTYLWREHAGLMRVSMLILGLLTLWALVQLAGHFGLITGAVADVAMPVIGIPFLIAAVVEIWLAIRAFMHYLRARRA